MKIKFNTLVEAEVRNFNIITLKRDDGRLFTVGDKVWGGSIVPLQDGVFVYYRGTISSFCFTEGSGELEASCVIKGKKDIVFICDLLNEDGE